MSKPASTHRQSIALASIVAAACIATPGAEAVEFQNDSGSLTGSWDTTLSYGQAWRIESRDCRLVANADGGCGRSPNIDDGNLNYNTGLYSRALKAVTELSLNYRSVGAFVRASGLYDIDIESNGGNTARTPLSSAAEDLVGSYTRLLDAFVYSKFDLGSMPAELRLGRQAVSWGESTFIQNGVNVINHFDVAALRVPGSELKEAFLPQEMVNFSLQFNDRWSAQAVYMLDWNPTIPEAAGSYFSPNDFAAVGGNKVFLGFGAFSDQGVDFRPLGGTLISDFQAVKRAADRTPDKSGQAGFNIKYFAQDFNNGTEFGLYFMNYHSRLPVISGRTGTAVGVANAWGTANAVQATALALSAGLPLATAIGAGAQAGVGASRSNRLGFVGNLSAAQATEYATHCREYGAGRRQCLGAGDQSRHARVCEDGAVFRRVSRRHQHDRPVVQHAAADRRHRAAGRTHLSPGRAAAVRRRRTAVCRADAVRGGPRPARHGDAAAGHAVPLGLHAAGLHDGLVTINGCNQLGRYGVDQDVQGWGLYDTWQAQFTATKTFANVLKAAQAVVVLESAVSHVPGLPNKLSGGPNGRGLRFNGPGTSVSGNAELASRHFGEVEPQNRFADATSWGYRLAGRLEYPGLMGPWNVVPRFSWQHDVGGTSPGPGGNFVEGRYGLTLGVSANLQARWEIDTSWTRFGGAGRFNDINDRDFVTASVKLSF